MTNEQGNMLTVAFDRADNDLADYRNAVGNTVNTMMRDVVHSLELTLPLSVEFSPTGGEPCVTYGGYRVYFPHDGSTPFTVKPNTSGEYTMGYPHPELGALGAALRAAQLITRSYMLATPRNINI